MPAQPGLFRLATNPFSNLHQIYSRLSVRTATHGQLLSCCSELRLVGVVRVGGVFGAVRSSERPVVVPQPEQPDQAWRRQDLQRNLQESSTVSSSATRWQCFQTSKCTLPILCLIYVVLLQTTMHSLASMYIFIVCVCVRADARHMPVPSVKTGVSPMLWETDGNQTSASYVSVRPT